MLIPKSKYHLCFVGSRKISSRKLKKGYTFRMETGSEDNLDRETSISNVQGKIV